MMHVAALLHDEPAEHETTSRPPPKRSAPMFSNDPSFTQPLPHHEATHHHPAHGAAFLRRCGRHGRRSAAYRARPGRLAEQGHPPRRAVRARRQQRDRRPRRCRRADQDPGPERLRRQQARRRRQRRDGRGGTCRGRAHDHPRPHRHAGGEPVHFRQAPLRPGEGVHAGLTARQGSQPLRCASGPSGQGPEGVHRPRQEQARPAELRLGATAARVTSLSNT
jgi:hypothetical protein